LAIVLACISAQAQQSPALPQTASPRYDAPVIPALRDPDKRTSRPVTPDEERERILKQYDPLSTSDPNQANENSTLDNPLTRPRPRQIPDGPEVVENSTAGGISPDGTGRDTAQAYTGPAVLSRSYTLSRPAMPQTVKWAPTLGFSTFYSTGLTANPQSATGLSGSSPVNPANSTSFGTQFNWGLSGTHLWKKDQMGMSYQGSASRYSQASAFNGTNHSLSLSLAHVIARRLVLTVGQTVQATSQSYSLENQLVDTTGPPTTVNLAGNPSIGVFDQGTRQYGSTMQLSWQPTSRTTVSMGGSVFFVSRTGTGLSGATGYQSQAEVTRRYTRKLTLGGFYSHTNYLFTKHVSASDSNAFGGIVGYSFNRLTQVRLRLGLSQVEAQSLAVVAIDPFIAQIIGQSTGIIQTYTSRRLQDVSAEFTRNLGHQRAMRVTYARGLAPGNGLILTSSRKSLSAGFNMKLFRNYDFNAGGGYDSLSTIDGAATVSLTQAANSYSSRSFQLGLSRGYRHGLTSSFSVTYQKIGGATNYGYGDVIRISSGVNWGGRDGHLW